MPGPETRPHPASARRLPLWWLGAAPILWLVALTLWVLVRWPHLPPMIPIHWSLAGFPDYWVRRAPSTVAAAMGPMSAICLAFIALAWLLTRQPPRSGALQTSAAEKLLRRQTALLIVACAWFVAFEPAFVLLPLPYRSFRVWMILFAATLVTGVIVLARSGLRLRRRRG